MRQTIGSPCRSRGGQGARSEPTQQSLASAIIAILFHRFGSCGFDDDVLIVRGVSPVPEISLPPVSRPIGSPAPGTAWIRLATRFGKVL